jgi:hypothetical protein
MSTEIVQLVAQATPYLTSALGAYGGAVLTRAEDAAVGATANLGRRLLQLVWSRRNEDGQAALDRAVQDAAEDTEDADATTALLYQLKRALRDDEELRSELAALMPESSGTVTITASGNRAIAAHSIGTAVTGDHTRIGE